MTGHTIARTVITGCLVLVSGLIVLAKTPLREQPKLRHPVAMVLAEEGRWLLVANRRSGTISTIDLQKQQVVAEVQAGRQLADLAIMPDGNTLLAVDEAAHQLVVLRRQGSALSRIAQQEVAYSPVDIEVSSDGLRGYVSSLWSRRLTLLDLKKASQPAILRVVDLPFAPRLLKLLPGDRQLVVADAFSGRLVVIDAQTGSVVAVHDLGGHNIRGLALSPDGQTLHVVHQTLNSTTATTEFSVHWGVILKNVMHSVSVAALPDKKADLKPAGTVDYFGIPDNAAGDPGPMVIARDGHVAVLFAGVSEVAVSDDGASFSRRLEVGRRPTALVLSPDESHIYVAGMFSDNVSRVNLATKKVVNTISLGRRPGLSLTDEGQMLFYDSRLASDGWYSCHSCHTDGHTNGGMNDSFSDGSFNAKEQEQSSGQYPSAGGAKRVLSLLGVGQTAPWAWNGSMKSLDAQIRKSITITMQGPQPSDRQVKALAAYLRTLDPPPSLDHARGIEPTAAARQGQAVFNKLNCSECHRPDVFTSSEVHAVGLHDKAGNTYFSPPSLRGVVHRQRLFHDQRADGLRDVLERYQHGLESKLAPKDLDDLIQFLRSL